MLNRSVFPAIGNSSGPSFEQPGYVSMIPEQRIYRWCCAEFVCPVLIYYLGSGGQPAVLWALTLGVVNCDDVQETETGPLAIYELCSIRALLKGVVRICDSQRSTCIFFRALLIHSE